MTKTSLVKDSLISHIQDLTTKSKRFKSEIESAKTTTKKQYFGKKIKKNNEELLQALIALENLNRKLKAENESSLQEAQDEGTDSTN